MVFLMISNPLSSIIELQPRGSIAVLLSNGLDSKVLLDLLKMVHDDVTTINLIRPSDRDTVKNADVYMDIVEGQGEYDRVCKTIVRNILPYYDQVWGGENAIPDLEWFRNHKDVPNRCSKRVEDNYYSPFLFLNKAEIVASAVGYGIDVSDTISCIVYSDRHCKECWFCKEREWGFNLNNLEVDW